MPNTVAGQRALVSDLYKKADDDVAGRIGGKSAVDKYLASLLRPRPHEPLRIGTYPDENGACGWCAGPHTFKGCPQRSAAEKVHLRLPPKAFNYFADNNPNDVTNLTPYPICCKTFKSLYQIGQKRLAAVQLYLKQPRSNVQQEFRQRYTPRDRTIFDDIDAKLKATLKKHDLVTSHYSSSTSTASTTYFLSGDLTQLELWKEFLREHDKDFVAQTQRMGFIPTYHAHRSEPTEAEYKKDSSKRKLMPLCSYTYARDYYARYDLKFETLKTDTCSKCTTLNSILGSEAPEAEKAVARAARQKHLSDASTAYAQKARDVASAKEGGGSVETIEIDLATALRTPYTTMGAAYFCQMQNTSLYIVIMHSTGEKLLFLFNETIEGKGADMVGSILAYVVQHYLRKRRPRLKTLNIHSDGTAGQVWNNAILGFVAEFVDPLSPFYCCERLDVNRGPVGHTFMQCDTIGGSVQKASLKYLKGHNHIGILSTFNVANPPPKFYSWEMLIEKCVVDNPTMVLIKLGCDDIKNIWKYINESSVFAIPTASSCATTPGWLISTTLHWNFGYGEKVAGGATTQHPGEVFTRTGILAKTDVVVLAPKGVVNTALSPSEVQRQLNARRHLMVDRLKVKHAEPLVMEWEKRNNIHKLMTTLTGSADGATRCGFGNPGPKGQANQQQEAAMAALAPVHEQRAEEEGDDIIGEAEVGEDGVE